MKFHLRRTLVSLLPLVALLVPSTPVSAQDLPPARPESVGLAPARLGRIAGAVTLIVRHGQIAWFDAQGMADREAGRPMQKDSIFRICSMSKPITSTAVMMLYEEGKFLLDDPISKYLPEFKSPKVLVKTTTGPADPVPAKREITIRDLLRHTAGLTYQWNGDLGRLYADHHVAHGLVQYDGTIGDSVKNLAALPLLFSPGERWEYSLSVDVLGRLVEVVSGLPFDEFLRTRVLAPLGMKDTAFYLSEAQAPRLAAAYTYYDGPGLQPFPATPITEGAFVYSADYPFHGPRKLFSGGAGLCSTAMDYARFCQMMLNGGKLGDVRLLSRKSVELMSHDQLGKINPDFAFGLGFSVDGEKGPLKELGSVGAFAWGGFFYTKFVIDPKEDMIVISMLQLHPTGGLTLDSKIQVLAYQAIAD